jgi:hypothetical protein
MLNIGSSIGILIAARVLQGASAAVVWVGKSLDSLLCNSLPSVPDRAKGAFSGPGADGG